MAATFSVSSKNERASYYLLAAAVLLFGAFGAAGGARAAETGVVSATGSGRDTPEAISSLLKATVAKHFHEEPAALVRSILQTEILPNASSFVQSYRIVESSKTGSVSLSASVDLDVIHALLRLTPKNIADSDETKALVLMRGAKLPEASIGGMKAGAPVLDPFAALGEAARDRFNRREFSQPSLTPAELQAIGEGEDYSSLDFLRGVGVKAGARIVLGLSGRFESHENENSHNKEDRLVVTATLVDAKAGTIVARSSLNVVPPKSRKEQYLLELQRAILEESKDLFQDIFVTAGRKLVKSEAHSEFAVVRVRFPSNAALVLRFKALLETIPGVRSVSEFSIRRGSYDFAIRPAMQGPALLSAITGLQAPDLAMAIIPPVPGEAEAQPPAVIVKVSPKDASSPGAGQSGGGGGQNEDY